MPVNVIEDESGDHIEKGFYFGCGGCRHNKDGLIDCVYCASEMFIEEELTILETWEKEENKSW